MRMFPVGHTIYSASIWTEPKHAGGGSELVNAFAQEPKKQESLTNSPHFMPTKITAVVGGKHSHIREHTYSLFPLEFTRNNIPTNRKKDQSIQLLLQKKEPFRPERRHPNVASTKHATQSTPHATLTAML